MNKKKVLFRKIYFITILTMLFTTALAGIQVMASTDSKESKIHWESNTKDKEIQVPGGVTGDGGKWESPTYTSSDDKTNSTSVETKPMSTANEYAAIAAGLVGVLALSAAQKSSNESVPSVSEGNGIWVPESDRDAVTKMINKAASKEYYIDANGFVKEVSGAVENLSKSSTYSSVLDRLIKGDNKVVIGVGDGWVSSGEKGLEANAFTGNNSGITIGDNGTQQVVVVSGKDMPGSSADITLAHELTHALRGEEGIKSINTIGGINKDEEAHTIEVENKIRTELGYAVRKDGDTSDGGDGSYGKYSDASEENWYNNIDKIQGSEVFSGNAYSYLIIGSIVSAAVHIISSIISSSSSHSSSSSSSRNNGSGHWDPVGMSISVWNSIVSGSTSSSSSSNYNSSPVPVPIPVWGSNYDDSIWGGVVRVVSNVVSSVVGWVSASRPKRNWDTFWSSATKSLGEGTKKVLSKIGTAISSVASIILGIPDIFSLGKLFNLGSKKQTGWIKDKDGNWYYYNPSGQIETDKWKQYTDGSWYYLDSSGKMATDKWKQYTDGSWYYLDSSGKMETDKWKQYTDGSWYYLDSSGQMARDKWINDADGSCYHLDSSGKMETGWRNIDGKEYFFDYSNGEMKKGWIKDSNDNWNYLNSNGKMATGWMEDNGIWRYFNNDNGQMETGWIDDNGKRYYFNSKGEMEKDKWLKNQDNGDWYHLDSDGKMQIGWIKVDGKDYYLYSDGKMKKGWLEESGNWYYLNTDGEMQTENLEYEGKEYYFNSSGQLQANNNNNVEIYDDGEYPDFTDSINKMLKRNQEECKQHKGDFDMGLSWFKSKVNHRAAWDIKLQGAWDEQVGETFAIKDENGNFRKFTYNGEVISAEELGNITYGYWGTATNYGPELLYIGGGYAANTAHSDYSDDLSTFEKLKIKADAMNDALNDSIYHCDDPDDHEAIKKGIDMYNEMNP